MANMIITSVQQYSINRIRVSLNTEYMTRVILPLKISLKDTNGNDLIDNFDTIENANSSAWEYEYTAKFFDLRLKRHKKLSGGSYRLIITEPKSEYCEEKMIFDDMITINHMEDIMIDISSVDVTALDRITLSFSPQTSADVDASELRYQTKSALELMTLNIYDDSGVSYGNCFLSLKEAIYDSEESDAPISSITLNLKENEVLPRGVYTFRFVNSFKNRTEVLYESSPVQLPYMTTTPPAIESARMYISASGKNVLGVNFSVAPEIGVYYNASYKIITKDGKDISTSFAKEVELITDSRANNNYVLRTEIPFMKDSYTIDKGDYIFIWNWNNPLIEETPTELPFNVGWMLHSASTVSLDQANDVVMKFTTPFLKPFVESAKFSLELNGVDVDTMENSESIYSAFGTIQEATTILEDSSLKDDDPINEIRINIKDRASLRNGIYTFLIYSENNGERAYQYMAQIDIVGELSPVISSVIQKSIDEILVILEKECPIPILELTHVNLIDGFSGDNLSDRLDSIANSNVWEPGQASVKEFILHISQNVTLAQGQYTIYLTYFGSDLKKFPISIEYMERRRGYISKIEQIDLEHMKISFSQTQSREFLLQTKLKVSRPKDGQDFTNRFVRLDIALEEGGYAVDDITIRMDWEDSFPRGRYLIQFVQLATEDSLDTVYEAEADLGHMTNNKPTIGSIITSVDTRGVTAIRLLFTGYIEWELYNQAIVSIITSDGADASDRFLPKDKWEVDTAEKQEIRFAKNITIPLVSKDTKINRDTYTITFHWNEELSYIDDVSKSIYMDYVLPNVTKAEMISTTRAYFEFPITLQTSWIESLKVEIFNNQGKNHTDLFKTVPESNDVSSGISSDNINLNMRENVDPIQDVSSGAYTFIFYHIINGVKEADYIAKIDVKGTVYPTFSGRKCCQEGINTFTFRLNAPISVDILQSYSMKAFNNHDEDISEWFQTITRSNPWEEDDIDPEKGGAVREVTEFDLKMKGRSLTKLDETLKIEGDTIRFVMVSNDGIEMDDCWIDVGYAEGIMYELAAEDGFEQVSLKKLLLKFQEEQNKTEFSQLSIKFEQIIDIGPDGTPTNTIDRTSSFISLYDCLETIDEKYFETIPMELAPGKVVPSNIEIVDGIEVNKGYYFSLMYQTFERSSIQQKVELEAPMTTQIPAIADIAATEDEYGGKGILITFSPLLAKELYDKATVKFVKRDNVEYDLFERKLFYDRRQWEVAIQEADDIQYVSSVTIPFNSDKTLSRDNYVITFEWLRPSFMKTLNMRKEVRLDYILKPIQSIEVIGIGKIRITFKTPLKQSYLNNCGFDVEYRFTSENEDGIITKNVSMSDRFEDLSVSNDFIEPETGGDPLWNSIILQLKPNMELMSGNYVFYIGHIETDDTKVGEKLKMVYSGTKYLSFLQNLITTIDSIRQGGLDFLYIMLNDYRDINMISTFNVSVKGSDGVDYSGYFLNVFDSNEYTYYDPVTGLETISHFSDTIERGITIGGDNVDVIGTGENQVHSLIKTARKFRLALAPERAIPAGFYTFTFKADDIEYSTCTTEVTFMTTTPPEISDMRIENSSLVVEFLPCAEATSMDISSYRLMTNKGFNDNGDVIGDDKTSSFSPISSSTKTIKEDGSIEYVPMISIPVMPNTSLAAGTYTLKWIWNEKSFIPNIEYTGALSVISQGVKSVMLKDSATIRVVLNEKKVGSYLKALKLAVCNEYEVDATELFQGMDESNSDIEDTVQTDEFIIAVEDGEDVVTGTYTFSLNATELDTDGTEVDTPVYVFSLNIVFMTTEFGEIENVDNLSADEFTLITPINDKTFQKSYIGKQVQLTTGGTREIMSVDNYTHYLGKETKVFSEPRIDELTIAFDDDVHPCLLTACDLEITNEAGTSVADYFLPITECNDFKPRKVLDKIEVTLEKLVDSEELESWKVNGSFIDEEDEGTETSESSSVVDSNRTPTFQTIEKSNDFPELNDGEIPYMTNRFVIEVDDGDIEEYQVPLLKLELSDSSGNAIAMKWKYNPILTTVETVRSVKLKLKDDTTLVPDKYSLSLSYINEPGLEGSVRIEAYSNDGDLPFLSTNIGSIESMANSGLYSILTTFTEGLPCDLFQSVNLAVIDSDGVDYAHVFEKISASNDFGTATFISELENKNQIKIDLLPGSALEAGIYTFEFYINLKSQDDEDSSSVPINYTLWQRTIGVPYMVRTQPISLKDVTQVGIDTMKFTLENPINVNLVQNFDIAIFNESKEELYTDCFEGLSYSNNFGASVMLTDNRYYMYSETGSGWSRVDTKQGLTLTDICYFEDANEYILAASTKLFISNDVRESGSFEVSYSEKVVWNCLIVAFHKVFAFGYNGNIIYHEKGGLWKEVTSPVQKAIICAYLHDDTLIAVGNEGTIITSKDGINWTKIESGFTKNLTGITYFGKYVDSFGSEITPSNEGYYVSTTAGNVLYSPDTVMWETISTGSGTALFSITSHNGMIIACGDIGTVVVSEDGNYWQKIGTEIKTSLRSVAYCDTEYVISSSNGKYLTSRTGRVWTTNSNIQGYSFKTIRNIPSQYEDPEKVDFFYARLNGDTSIGTISIFEGPMDPNDKGNEKNPVAIIWTTNDMRKRHIGDIYFLTSIKNGISSRVKRYQYSLSTDGIYSWVEITGNDALIPSTGSYTAYILRDFTEDIKIENIDDTKKLNDKEIVCEKSEIRLNYMTANPGMLHKPDPEDEDATPTARIGSPDVIIDDRLLETPYLQIEFDLGDELAMYYADYTIYTGDGTDISDYFSSLRDGLIIYGSSMYVQYLILPIKEEKIKSIRFDSNIRIEWTWCTFNRNAVDVGFPVIFKKPIPVVSSVYQPEKTIDRLSIKLEKEIPKTFMIDSESGELAIRPHVYRIKEDTIHTSDLDYMDQFDEINTLQVDDNGQPIGFDMKLAEGCSLPSGKYIFMIETLNEDELAHLENDTTVLYTSYVFSLGLALQENYPKIVDVDLTLHENEVERIVETGQKEYHLYPMDPTDDHPLTTAKWYSQGVEACKSHVGDEWKNSENPERKFAWTYDASTGTFEWQPLVTAAHLEVEFSPYPAKNAVLTQMNHISLIDRVTDIINGSSSTEDRELTSFLSQDVGEWDIEFIGSDKEYVNKVLIPIDDTRSFPGTQNAKFTMEWAVECPYDMLSYPEKWPNGNSKLVLPERAIDYGAIKTAETYSIPPDSITDLGEAGIVVTLTHALSTEWLSKLEFSLTHNTLNSEGVSITADIAGDFKSIQESNSEWFDEIYPVKKTDTIRFQLLDGMEIDAGDYKLELIGEKDTNDIETDREDDGMVYYTRNVKFSFVTANPPKEISVNLGNKDGYSVPVLTIEFTDELPHISAILKYSKLKVEREEDGVDYADCFCACNEKSGSPEKGFSYDMEKDSFKVRRVYIPMKNARVLKEGTYDVMFYFSLSSSLTYVPLFGKIASFKVNGAAITPLGKVLRVTTPTRTECHITVQFDPSIKDLNSLRSSQIGKTLNITSYDALWKKLDLVFQHQKYEGKYNGTLNHAFMFKGYCGCSSNGATYKTKLRDNYKINPGKPWVSFKMGDCVVFTENRCEFKGCILNKVGNATKDKVCYIVKEMRGGVTKRRVYKSYAKAKKRIDKLKKLNAATKEQIKVCKKCRKLKLLSNSKIKAQIEKLLVKEGHPSNAVYKAAANYYFDVMAPKLKCDRVMISVESSDTDGYDKIMCDNYVSPSMLYEYQLRIATMATGFPGKKSKSKKIYFQYIIKDGCQLDRGFKANNKGKKTPKCKKFAKKLAKYIKAYKKKVSLCKKCKKKVLAKKSSSTISWSSALFPDAIRTGIVGQKKDGSNIVKNLKGSVLKEFNKSYKGSKKKKTLCKKKNRFKLVKKDSNYCRLTCTKVSTTDKTLEYGCYKATFIK